MRIRGLKSGAAMAAVGVLAAVWALAEAPLHPPQTTASAQPQSSVNAAPTPQGLPEFRDIVRSNRASVVHISTTQVVHNAAFSPFNGMPDGLEDGVPDELKKFFRGHGGAQPQDREAEAVGSGFIISADGKILTNAHVVDGASTVTVKLADNSEYQAKVVGKDKQSDIAVLKIDAKNLPVVHMGDSDQLSVGEWVLAIGSPFGLDYSATQGIVSALGRALPNETYVPFIQTDAAVNPGNSGGPLFNTRGEVVGINSQIYSQSGGYQGLSFAIPINTARAVATELEKSGRVSRGWLGVQIQAVSNDLAQSFGLDRPHGALVGNVDEKGPAAKAGLQSGDIILSFDNHALNSASDLPPLVGTTPVGRTVELKVLRDGRELTLRPIIAALKDDVRQANANDEAVKGKALLNIAVEPLSDEARKQGGVREGGVLVARVNPGPAARAGIEAGDIIVKIGSKKVEDPAQFIKLVQSLPRGKPVAFLVQRDGAQLFVAVNIPSGSNDPNSESDKLG
jgi:serine protease Do